MHEADTGPQRAAPRPRTALEWRRFYAREREQLGEAGLLACLDAAPRVELPARGALVFPHTRLRDTGALVAAVCSAVLRSGAQRVLALGVLHGGREADAELVSRARAGDPAARTALRRVHGEGNAADAGHWREEFSLDGFSALLELAARRAGRQPPGVISRFPFLLDGDPASLAGMDELAELLQHGDCALVATTDPIHHGVGYATPQPLRARDGAATRAWARAAIESGFASLARGDWPAFASHSAEHRSDFRDAGPVLAALLGPPLEVRVHELALVDYADALGSAQPTWVAGALASFAARR